MKIDFIIAGAQKCGTTALHECLIAHPEIFMPKNKEVHYFDNEHLYKNDPGYKRYHSFFDEHEDQKVLGEATPIYIYWHGALERIHQYNKEMKVIIILRNPIERAYSHWNMERSRGNEHLPFIEAIQQEISRCADILPAQHRVYSYVDRGHYIDQLRKLWNIFPKKQTLIINSTSLRHDQRDTLLEVYEFLGIESTAYAEQKNPPPLISHKGVYTYAMSENEREYLKNIYFWEIKELEIALGWDCSEWVA